MSCLTLPLVLLLLLLLLLHYVLLVGPGRCFFFSSRRRHTSFLPVSWAREMCIRDRQETVQQGKGSDKAGDRRHKDPMGFASGSVMYCSVAQAACRLASSPMPHNSASAFSYSPGLCKWLLCEATCESAAVKRALHGIIATLKEIDLH